MFFRYRDASREVMAVLCDFCSCVEKASIDEAYLDLTDCISSVSERVEWESLKNTFVVGYSSDSEGIFISFSTNTNCPKIYFRL